MSKKYYKFLRYRNGKIVSNSGNQEWMIDKEYEVNGDVHMCRNGFHASKQPLQALNYVHGEVLAIVEASGEYKVQDDKVCYQRMRIVKAYMWTKEDSVLLAIYSAEQVIKIYEEKYPNDSRPRDAIKAAKAYLKDPSKKTRAAAYAAYAAAYAAADAAYAAYAAADAAAYAAAYAAYAAYAAADAAAYAAADAAYAAYAADRRAGRAGSEVTANINRWMKARVKKLHGIK